MSRTRHPQGTLDPRGRSGAAVTTLTYDYPPSHVIPPHFHEQHQLLYAAEGVTRIQTVAGVWTVPPQQAVWIPGRVDHSLRMLGPVRMSTLYFAPRLASRMLREVRAVNVTPLLRELVLHICALGALDRRKARDRRLFDVLVDQLDASRDTGLQLTLPRDPRALRVARALLDGPSDDRALDPVCGNAGGSRRTIERAFRTETGMALGEWRRRAALLHAIALLGAGASVSTVALETGYATPSAFVTMFRRALGTTPGRYLVARSAHGRAACTSHGGDG